MNTTLWVTQSILAVIFTFSGLVKGTLPKDRLVATGQTGVVWYSRPFIRFIATCELFGAAGLMLPWWTGIARVLTPLAAVGLGIIMIGAAASHARLVQQGGPRAARERFNVAANLVLLAACAFVAFARGRMLS
jgi:hypothetical protein